MIEGRRLRVLRSGKTLLRDVSISAKGGEVLGVLGPSGAGKSTLFRALTGDGPADGGEVLLNGIDVTSWPLWKRARAGVGYVPQSQSVLLSLTVRDNLETFLTIARGEATGIEEAASRVGLRDRLDVRPKVLICDEPFAGVDPAGASQLAALLRELADDGAAVMLADHHVAEALDTCDRAILLLDGEVAVDATPEGFREHPLVQGRYLGTWTRSLPPSE